MDAKQEDAVTSADEYQSTRDVPDAQMHTWTLSDSTVMKSRLNELRTSCVLSASGARGNPTR